jgi:hypothetical protein
MKIYANQAGMTSLDVIANGTFFFHQPEPGLLKPPHQLPELHRLNDSSFVANAKAFVAGLGNARSALDTRKCS